MYLLFEIRGRGLKPPGPPGSTVSKNNNDPNLLIVNESPVSGEPLEFPKLLGGMHYPSLWRHTQVALSEKFPVKVMCFDKISQDRISRIGFRKVLYLRL